MVCNAIGARPMLSLLKRTCNTAVAGKRLDNQASCCSFPEIELVQELTDLRTGEAPRMEVMLMVWIMRPRFVKVDGPYDLED